MILLLSSYAHSRRDRDRWSGRGKVKRARRKGVSSPKCFLPFCHSLSPTICLWVSEDELCMALLKFFNSNLSKLLVHVALFTGLVGLAISYALSVTDRLSGMVTSFTETEKQMVSVERAVQYIEDIQPEVNPRGSVSIYLQARNVIRDRNS